MKKIAVVGVEGSGKTVLMAALGDKYKLPDANGIYLKPVNRKTFAYCENLMGQMQDGEWPIATGKAITDNLRWTLIKKIADGDDDKIAELSFLDFGGEIYRLAFGGGVHENLDEDTKNAIAQLRSHVEEAEVLIVLVNLSDIINGKRNEERTIEMNWLSQAILSFVYDEANKSRVALVFTQADSYAETIADCGDLRGVLTRYLPTVDTSYGKRLALFSVAAVDKTVPAPDGSGFQVPAPDFSSTGFDSLLEWIIAPIAKPKRPNRWHWALFYITYAISTMLLLFGIECKSLLMTLPGFVLLLVLGVVHIVKPKKRWWRGVILGITYAIFAVIGAITLKITLSMNVRLFWWLFTWVMFMMVLVVLGFTCDDHGL